MGNPNDVTVVPLNIFQCMQIRFANKGNKLFINVSVISDNNARVRHLDGAVQKVTCRFLNTILKCNSTNELTKTKIIKTFEIYMIDPIHT